MMDSGNCMNEVIDTQSAAGGGIIPRITGTRMSAIHAALKAR
jgi:hypothetical protein